MGRLIKIDRKPGIARLSDFWDNHVPVNPIAQGEKIGLTFRKNPSPGFDLGFREDADGKLCAIYRPSGNVLIDRFLTARLFVRFIDQETEGDETAPLFIDWTGMRALRFLMPDPPLRWAVRVSDMNTIEQIADYFGVIPDACRWRLDNFLGERTFAKKGTGTGIGP